MLHTLAKYYSVTENLSSNVHANNNREPGITMISSRVRGCHFDFVLDQFWWYRLRVTNRRSRHRFDWSFDKYAVSQEVQHLPFCRKKEPFVILNVASQTLFLSLWCVKVRENEWTDAAEYVVCTLFSSWFPFFCSSSSLSKWVLRPQSSE